MDSSFDCIVLGGGSAGYAAARTATAYGLKTAVVDGAETLGGLCILRGCMPSKTLLESASRFLTLRRAREFGLRAEGLAVHPGEIRDRKRALVAGFADFRREQLESGRFELVRGRASLVGPHEVEVRLRDGGVARLAGRTLIIATGSTPVVPEVPGLRESGFLTSDGVLDADTLPDSLIVLGGGPIALELACFHQALGIPVTVVQRNPHLVKFLDFDLTEELAKTLQRQGMVVATGTRLLAVRRRDGRTTVEFDQGGTRREATAGALLCALGRQPATTGLGLETSPIETSGARVVADAWQRTSQAHVFAAGDACGPHEIVHLAIEQGETAATNAAVHLGALPPSAVRRMDYRLKLFAMFTFPELAAVGLSEREAAEAGRKVVTATYPFNDHGKSLVMGETEGFVKLVADPASGEILGGAVLGPHASELIHEIVVAMRFRGKAADLAGTPHYHPTLSEIWTYPAEEIVERIGP